MSSWLNMVMDAWEKAGRPPYREVARGAGVNHETIRQALNGSRAVSEKTAVGLARHLLEPVDADIAIGLWRSAGPGDTERIPPRRRPSVVVHPSAVELRKLLREHRIRKGLRQKDLAARLGLSTPTASELENYDQNHSNATYARWAAALDVEFGLYTVIDGDFRTINCSDADKSAGQ